MLVDVSIIIPVYNVEKYIEQCLETVCNQTLKDVEIIVVDDGSLDNSINIVKKFKDKRIKIITRENGGLSAARNTGMKAAQGEYLLFLDSDDFFNNSYCVEEMYNLALENNADIVVGNGIEYYSDERNTAFYRDKSEFYSRSINSRDFLIKFINKYSMRPEAWLNLYKRDMLIKNKLFFKEGILHEDELFTPQAFLLADNIYIYDKNFYMYRQRENSIMHSRNNLKRGRDLIIVASELINKYKNIKDKELRKAVENKPFNLIQIALIQHDVKKINNKLKAYLVKKSKTLKQFLLNLTLFINVGLYKKIIRVASKIN